MEAFEPTLDGLQVTQEEAEELGAFEETALSEFDAAMAIEEEG